MFLGIVHRPSPACGIYLLLGGVGGLGLGGLGIGGGGRLGGGCGGGPYGG